MIHELIKRLDEATCNFRAVEVITGALRAMGYTPLEEGAQWDITPGSRHYLVKNDSAVFAFHVGTDSPSRAGYRIIAAHSDSPCFKLKPNPEMRGDGGVVSLNVEKYGGGIMYTWFDRPLSIAGRVMLRGEDPLHPRTRIVDLRRPVATIPHLAIHFNRAVNEGNPLSVQKDMKPVLGYCSDAEYEAYRSRGGWVRCIVAAELGVEPEEIIGSELCLYPFQKATIVGEREQYLQSARIDDLSMAFCGLAALEATDAAETGATRVLAIFDNEETGSATKQGAASPTLRNALKRIARSLDPAGPDAFERSLGHTFMISADDAHAWHPNYNEKYDPTNHPVIGGGPVVKINANCKYMTDARGAAIFAGLCAKAGVSCQYFVNHGDVAGGSTLGNILTSQLDIPGVDMGCAIWGMHSAAETAGISDHEDTVRAFAEFWS